MQYLTFRLNGVEYAVDVRIVETVVERGEITAVPTPVEYMQGVMDLRGRVIPVIDLRKKFGLPDSQASVGSSVIVFPVETAEGKSLTVGALVDEVSEVLSLEEGHLEEAQSEGAALWESYILGIARYEGRMIIILEVDGLFSLRDLAAIGANGDNRAPAGALAAGA